jgi:cell division protein FtsI/penicillin-binding protein 2
VTARSREQGSSADRPRGAGFPFSVPGLSGLSGLGTRPAPAAGLAPGQGTLPDQPAEPLPGSAPAPGGTAPGGTLVPGPSPAPGVPSRGGGNGGRGHRHRKQSSRGFSLSRKQRLAAISLLVIAAFCVGLTNGFGSEASAEPTVQAFLFEWQSGHYAQAAALTTGDATQVTTELAAAYSNLDASDAFFVMGKVAQHGDTATATFHATVDLAQAGQQWAYTGQFKLRSRDGHWLVDWAPSVINPRLGAGDRLAVVSAYPRRAEVEDMSGRPLIVKSADYRIGVHPGELKDATATAKGFSGVTGLNEQQVLGQLQAAPPSDFLSLLTLSQANFTALWPRLSKVPGLSYQRRTERLFSSPAPEVVGEVGTENSAQLRAEGAAYQPGATVGLTGLQQLYQDGLAGTPTTSVVVVNAAGHMTGILWNSPGGHAGTPVRTTLSSKQQSAAVTALTAQSNSAEIVALDARTGAIRVLASRDGSHGTLPSGGTLNAEVEPGMAFSIVSAAALLSKGIGLKHPLPCEPVANVGGETFTYQPNASSGATLASDFANGCGTAFANMSRTLTPQQLTAAERGFGIGAKWQLPLSAFSGSAPTVSGEADVAAQATGTGGVLMSPLGMATVAAEVAAGAGHSPVLLATDSSTTWHAPLSGNQLSDLRALMRLAVTKGSAHAADIPGTPVYGQAGVVNAGKHSYLSWFVGYRGTLAISVLETGSTPHQAAAALAGAFLKALG